MPIDIQVAVIGGGVVGCAVAMEISGHYDNVFLFEKNPGITQGENQSSRNSGVIHSGIYYDLETRPNKAALCVSGNRMLFDFCRRHHVPALETGKLIVASHKEEETLDLYLDRARQNRVPGVEKISGARVRDMEPNVFAESALLVPSAGIVDPTSLVYRLHTIALRQGVSFITGTEVTGLEKKGGLILLHILYPDGKRDLIRANAVVNAAGVHADRLARIFNPGSPYEIDPVTGESYKFYLHKRPELGLNGMNVYPTPETVTTAHGQHFTVGIHLTPTFRDTSFPPKLGSTVIIGPRLVPAKKREERPGPLTPPRIFADKASLFFPGIKEEDLIWHQAGTQARLRDYPDFVIKADESHPFFINLLGIDSPGLTSCLAIARRVKKMLADLNKERTPYTC